MMEMGDLRRDIVVDVAGKVDYQNWTYRGIGCVGFEWYGKAEMKSVSIVYMLTIL